MPSLHLANNVDLNYQVDGTGKFDYLLFNGATLPLEFWGSLAERMSATGRVIRFDQRNAGRSRFEGTFTLNDVAADAAGLLAHLESEQVIVLGHAWGGRAAQVFARDYPHLVRSLVICATGGQKPPVDTTDIDQALRTTRKSGDRKTWDQAWEKRWCAAGFAERNPETFKELTELTWNIRANRSARWDPRVSPSASYWGTATVPTLLIYGEQDKNGTPANAKDLHGRISGSELLMFPEAGHFVTREQEDDVLEAVTEFVI